MTRRSLIRGATGWAMAGTGLARAGAARPAVAELPSGNWGAVRRVAEGVWAIESTPLAHRDFKTVCNGGIVAGDERVLVVEAFAGRAGAQWVAEAARKLSGRWPTDVVVTHYHGDHTAGLTGFRAESGSPRLYGTRATLDRLAGSDDNQEGRERREMLAAATLLEEDAVTRVDLGGVAVALHPFRGHTASDVVVELPERELAFAGDLLWNGMIPNFVDARPIELSRTLRALRERGARSWVPGHGALGEPGVLELNIELADFLEQTARTTLQAGIPASEAAARAELPAPFDAWVAFSANYVERAISAWHRDLQ